MHTEYITFGYNTDPLYIFLRYLQITPDLKEGYRWGMTISSRIYKTRLLYEDILEQIPKSKAEFEEVQTKGFSGTREGEKLAIRYECYLNSIYSLCDSFAFVIQHLLKERVPEHFHDQRKKLLKDPSIEPEYSKILQNTPWYDEVHTIRSEATHYHSGMTTFSRDGQPGYFNQPIRANNIDRIDIDEIERHLPQVQKGVDEFLIALGDYFIKFLDQDKTIQIPCMYSNSSRILGIRLLTIREQLNKMPGKCHAMMGSDCPLKDRCRAYLNTVGNT